jgi:hypothetical protein
LPTIALRRESFLKESVDKKWQQAVSRLEHKASLHPLDRRFGPAQTWKGYFLILETLRIRVAEVIEMLKGRAHDWIRAKEEAAFREKTFSALGGKLCGRIDLMQGDEIIDYKTGALFDTDNSEPSLKLTYIRQLRIYAYLAHSATGTWPQRGLLFPLAGPPVVVDLEPSECEREAEEAVNLLTNYNQAIATAETANNIASPSPEVCRWCPYKIICSPFWSNASEGWSGTLAGEAISGRLVKAPLAIRGGAAWSISVKIDAGTAISEEVVLSPLNSSIHNSVSTLGEGERVRVVGLARRSNGSLFPTERTVVVADVNAPSIQFERNSK